MNKKYKILGLGLFFTAFSSIAQTIDPDAYGYYEKALAFSQSYFGGTARMQGLAGAQTALGADPSAPLANPAGLGLFRKSMFTISPAIQFNNSSSNFRSDIDNQTSINNKDNFNISNMAIIFANSDEGGQWKSEGFAITYNRINNYNSRISYKGMSDNSIGDYYVNKANSLSSNPDDLSYADNGNAYDDYGQAYDTYLLNHDNLGYWRYSEGVKNVQEEYIVTKGSNNQWDFGYGANYENKLFLGASIGIPTIRKEINRTYKESFEDKNQEINSIHLTETEITRGTGINVKAGLIYHINDMIRIGASAQSPTYYRLREEFQSSLTTKFNFIDFYDTLGNVTTEYGNSYTSNLVPYNFTYNLVTPYRLNTGLSFFFGKNGFISADIEYVGYNRMSLNSNTDNFQGDNQTIRNIYKPSMNYRLGGEFRHKNFRLRGGYAYYSDPIREGVGNIDLSRQFFTGGLGLKFENYFVDLGVVYSLQNAGNTRYSLGGAEPTIVSKLTNTNIVFTWGTNF